MRKLDIRFLALAAALTATACFTPADLASQVENGADAGHDGGHGDGHGEAGEAHGEGGEAHGEGGEAHGEGGDAHGEGGEAHGEAAHDEHAGVIEGIIPNTEGRKADFEAPSIEFEPPFDGEPLGSKTLASGVVVEDYLLGEGEGVVDGKQVEFKFTGYASASAKPVMGSRAKPAKLVLDEANRERDPIANAMADALQGMKVGGKRKIMIPADIVEEGAPPGRPSVGDIYMAVELVGLADPFVPQPVEAYEVEPVRTVKKNNGLEIYDITEGEGREAQAGDQVVTHYLGQLTDGTEFDSSHSRAEGLPVTIGAGGVITGFSEGLEGARPGMLRKVVIPPELGYGEQDKGKIPPNSTLVFFLEIVSVEEGGGVPGGAPPPRPAPPRPPKPTDKVADAP